MSQSSDGVEQFWLCPNPACSHDPISLALGSTFQFCPFCNKPWKPLGLPTESDDAAGVETKETHDTCRTEPPSLEINSEGSKLLPSIDGENITQDGIDSPCPPAEKSTTDTEDPPLQKQPGTYADNSTQVGSSAVESEVNICCLIIILISIVCICTRSTPFVMKTRFMIASV